MDQEGTFAELLRERQRSGRHGTKKKAASKEKQLKVAVRESRQSFHRDNKNRPSEVTSKKPVSRHKDVLQIRSSQSTDPRFEETSGKVDQSICRQQYAFVYDIMNAEAEELKSTLRTTKNSERQNLLRAQIKELEKTVAKQKQEATVQKQLQEAKVHEREAVKQGKRPFYLKASDRKKQALIQRYQKLKASGGLEKAMTKRRQKVAAKDHRLVPRARRQAA